MGDRVPADYGLDRALDVPQHQMTDESFLRASLINAREFWPDVKAELKQANLAVEALNICIKQDDEALAAKQHTIDALVAALERARYFIYAPAEDLRDSVVGRIDAALALARGGK